jgi:hypothetical protein
VYALALAVRLMADQGGWEQLYVAMNDHEWLGFLDSVATVGRILSVHLVFLSHQIQKFLKKQQKCDFTCTEIKLF